MVVEQHQAEDAWRYPPHASQGSGGLPLPLPKQPDCLAPVSAADIHHGAKTTAYRGTLGQAKQAATQPLIELDAGHTSGFPQGHAGNGTADTGGDTTSGTAGTTFHDDIHPRGAPVYPRPGQPLITIGVKARHTAKPSLGRAWIAMHIATADQRMMSRMTSSLRFRQWIDLMRRSG